MSQVVAVISDLIFRSRVAGAARAVGGSVIFASSAGDLATALETNDVRRVLVDLSEPAEEALRAITLAAGAPPHPEIVAFFPHVQKELADAARRAGAHRVLARSAFVAELEQLVSCER